MTRYEDIKQMSREDLGYYLCALVTDSGGNCDKCPATSLCFSGRNGMVARLGEEGEIDG